MYDLGSLKETHILSKFHTRCCWEIINTKILNEFYIWDIEEFPSKYWHTFCASLMKVVLIRPSLIAFFVLPSSNFFIYLVYTYTYTSTQSTNWLIFLHLFTVSYSLINQLSVQQLDLVAKNSITHLVVCCNCDSEDSYWAVYKTGHIWKRFSK